jgi:hypothetical protein
LPGFAVDLAPPTWGHEVNNQTRKRGGTETKRKEGKEKNKKQIDQEARERKQPQYGMPASGERRAGRRAKGGWEIERWEKRRTMPERGTVIASESGARQKLKHQRP